MKIRVVLAILIVGLLAGSLVYSQRRSLPRRVSGFVEADEVRVGSRIGGRVEQVLVAEGERVTQGQVLLRLEAFDLQERLLGAEAILAARRAELTELESGLRPQEIAQASARVVHLQSTLQRLKNGPLPEELAAAEARLELARAQLDRASKSHQRTNDLFNQRSSAVSREELDQAIELFKVAEANKQVRSEELLLLKRGTRSEDIAAAAANLEEASQAYALAMAGFRKEDIDQASAQVAASQAGVDAIKKQMGELEIRASVNGIVDALQLRPGDLVAPNAPVLSLIDTHRLWIRAYIPENELHLQLGTRFPVSIDSFPGEIFQAELTFISTLAEFTPRNVQTVDERAKQVFKVKFYLTGDAGTLHPGMAADVWLDQPTSPRN